VAERLDAGEQNLEVEGSIAKLYATEAGNRAAEDAMQALGGYGYITEYLVEKIKRDIRITCIYEGTSEIQQNIISTFRWKKTRKTKGAFYENLAAEMDRLTTDCGGRHIALAARILNRMISLANDNRLTREQFVMFLLADMMMHVEIAASLARKAGADSDGRSAVFARLFAAETAELVSRNTLKVLQGAGPFDKQTADGYLAEMSHAGLNDSYRHLIADMNRAADIVFGRASAT
jgi:alkylation response protein AidB-like acyl-CoA dehydrogenase